MVREVELAQARIYEVQGKDVERSVTHPMGGFLDEDYLMKGNHLDESTRKKIINGEYVDFSKLMPKDRISLEEDHRMEMVSRGGMSFWCLWQREKIPLLVVFCVFANVYTEAYLGKSSELIRYNHVIQTAAQIFAWDNMYRYDREFLHPHE